MAQKVSARDTLTEKIKALELQEAAQMIELKKRVHEFKHSLSPAALIATAYNGLKENKEVQGNIIDSSVGAAAGWALRKLLARKTGSVLTRFSGYALQYLATRIITKKMPAIREKIHLDEFMK